MIHKNICGWNQPELKDGDIIDGGTFAHCELPDLVLTFIRVNLYGCKANPKHTYIDCKPVDAEPDNTEMVDEFTTIKEDAKNKLLEIKPLAYTNPLAVKVALSEAFTPEEFNGVMEAE